MPIPEISKWESTLQDATVTIHSSVLGFETVCARGDKKRTWVGGWKITPGEKSGIVPGANGKPRAHTEIVSEPKFTLTVPAHIGVWMVNWARAGDKLISVMVDIRPPGALVSVVKLVTDWLPLMPDETIKPGDVTLVDVNGNALEYDPDYKGALPP